MSDKVQLEPTYEMSLVQKAILTPTPARHSLKGDFLF